MCCHNSSGQGTRGPGQALNSLSRQRAPPKAEPNAPKLTYPNLKLLLPVGRQLMRNPFFALSRRSTSALTQYACYGGRGLLL
jgi:hypothetical protein